MNASLTNDIENLKRENTKIEDLRKAMENKNRRISELEDTMENIQKCTTSRLL